MEFNQKQYEILIDLIEDKIFMEEDINRVEKLEEDEYLKELKNILYLLTV
jgi:hypothetical protein